MSEELKPCLKSALRAMASNYAGLHSHCWDHLDSDTCTKAADEIAALEAENARLIAMIEDWEADANLLEKERDAALSQLAAIQGGMGEAVGFDRNAAYAACPESGCDWGSFYVGWKAAAAQHQRITAAMAAEVERWERSFREIHEPALRDAHAYIQELRAELASVKGE